MNYSAGSGVLGFMVLGYANFAEPGDYADGQWTEVCKKKDTVVWDTKKRRPGPIKHCED